MLDPIRRRHLVFALLELLRHHDGDLHQVDIGADTLLRRARVTWDDLLSHPVVPSDPEPVRQAAVMAQVVLDCRQHALPGDLVMAAIWCSVAPTKPEFAEMLRTTMSRLFLSEEAHLRAVRIGIEASRARPAENKAASSLITTAAVQEAR